jgi:thioredoxin-like negative regulator of GroEL
MNARTLEKLDGLSLEAFRRRLVDAEVPVVVAFVLPADDRTAKLNELLDRADRELGGQVQFMTCDALSVGEVAEAYHLERLPDVLVFDGVRVTERLYGIESYEELKNIVENGVSRCERNLDAPPATAWI